MELDSYYKDFGIKFKDAVKTYYLDGSGIFRLFEHRGVYWFGYDLVMTDCGHIPAKYSYQVSRFDSIEDAEKHIFEMYPNIRG